RRPPAGHQAGEEAGRRRPRGRRSRPRVTPARRSAKMVPMNEEQLAKVREGRGFVAALDQSGGSTPKGLQLSGIPDDAWSGDEEMFARMHEMRSRIVPSRAFDGDRILGAIL